MGLALVGAPAIASADGTGGFVGWTDAADEASAYETGAGLATGKIGAGAL